MPWLFSVPLFQQVQTSNQQPPQQLQKEIIVWNGQAPANYGLHNQIFYFQKWLKVFPVTAVIF
jgi:hypothetical protein